MLNTMQIDTVSKIPILAWISYKILYIIYTYSIFHCVSEDQNSQ